MDINQGRETFFARKGDLHLLLLVPLITVSRIGIAVLFHYNDVIMSASIHQPHDCLLNCSFRRRSKKTSKLRVTGLCAGNSSGTGEFPAQMASNSENVSIWWRHHVSQVFVGIIIYINYLLLVDCCVLLCTVLCVFRMPDCWHLTHGSMETQNLFTSDREVGSALSLLLSPW